MSHAGRVLQSVLVSAVVLVSIPARAAPPTIWSVDRVEATIGNGRSVPEQRITFTVDRELRDVDLWVVPALQEYVSVSPSHFDVVQANTSYEIAVEFSLPHDAEPGPVNGTLHLRSGSRTIAQPLPVMLTVDFGDLVLSDRARVLSPETVEKLTSVSEDQSQLVFSKPTAELRRLAAGDVIVIGPSSLTPEGLLREVVQVTISRAEVTVETTGATLEDIIEDGTLQVSEALESIGAGQTASQAERLGIQAAGPQGFYVSFDDVVLFDLDGNKQTTWDQVVVDGSVYLNPWLDVDLQFSNSTVSYFRFAPTLTTAVELDALARVEILSFDQTIAFPSFLFARLIGGGIKPIIIWAGPVPVVITVGLSPYFASEGSVYAGFTTSVSQSSTGQVGVQYFNGGWSPLTVFDVPAFEFERPRPTAGAELKVAVGMQLSAKLYGYVGPFVSSDYYLDFDSDVFANPWWELYGGWEVFGGFHAGFGKFLELGTWEFPARFGRRYLLAQAEDSGACLPIQNPSFETPEIYVPWVRLSELPGEGGPSWVGSFDLHTDLAVSDGRQVVDLNQNSYGYISQTFATTPGTTYVLTFAHGVNHNCTSSAWLAVDIDGAQLATFSSVRTPADSQVMFTATGEATALTFRSLTGGCGAATIDDVRVCRQ